MSQLGITGIARWLGLGRPDRVGIDIEPTSVLMLELIAAGKHFKLDKFNCKELPANCFIKDYINDPAVLGRVVRDIVRESALAGNHSVIAAPSKLVTTQQISIKHEADSELQEKMVWAEAKKAFPDIFHRIYLDYIILPKKERAPEVKNEKEKAAPPPVSDHDDVLLVAAHKQAMQTRLEAMRLGGVDVDVIDVDYYALERCYQLIKNQLPDEHRNEYVALLNIDTSSILLAVFHKDEQVHTYHHTYNIAQLENVVSAQLQKCMGIKPAPDAAPTTAALSQVQQDQLINQIRYVLNTFSTQVTAANIDRVVLSGRCALIPDFDKLLQSKLGLKMSEANPFSDMKFALRINRDVVNQLAPACLLACGLAMRNCDDDKN